MTRPGLKKGSSGEDVLSLQSFLKQYGYLRPDTTESPFLPPAVISQLPTTEPGEFDDATHTALITFQKFYGLEPTGRVDEETEAALNLPRCGVADLPPSGVRALAAGDAWPRPDLTYGFKELTDKIPNQAQVKNAMIEALAMWSAVTPLTFQQIPIENNPDFIIRFVTAAHGDGSPFDGPRGVLAHAFYPPPNGGDIAGDCHFDETENWTVNIPVASNEIDLVTVAAHEFGHSLGLVHSNDISALMFPAYLGSRRYLDGDDAPRIQGLYGRAVDDGGTVLGRCGIPELVYINQTDLDLYTSTAVFGVRQRQFRNNRWLQWQDLGGEDGMQASVNTRAVVEKSSNRLFTFTFSTNKEIQCRVIDSGTISDWINLGGRRGHAFFAVADTGSIAAYITGYYDPDSIPGSTDTSGRHRLFEKVFDGAGFGSWTEIEGNVSQGVAAVADQSSGSNILFIGDENGNVKYAEGSASAWSPFRTLDGDIRINVNYPFHPIAAVFAAPDDLHLVVRREDDSIAHHRRVNGNWQAWSVLSNRVRGDPLLVTSGGGRVHVLANDENVSAIMRTFDGTWSNWVSLGGSRWKRVIAAAASQNRVDYLLSDNQGISMHDFRVF